MKRMDTTQPAAKTSNLMRMAHYLVLGALMIFLAWCFSVNPETGKLSVLFWKLGCATLAAYLGYWLDRHLFTRISADSPPLTHIRRAIVVAACIIAVSMGL